MNQLVDSMNLEELIFLSYGKQKSIREGKVVIGGLWASGIIPKQMAKTCATNYLKKNFPKAQLEYVDIEWSPSHGGYLIRFKDENNKIHSFIINNKYFPIKLGQGVFAFREEYTEKYDKVEWDTDIGDYRVIKN